MDGILQAIMRPKDGLIHWRTYASLGLDKRGDRADSRLAAPQWETSLQSNAVSHCLGANLESALWWYK